MTELDKYKNISQPLQHSIYQHPMLLEFNKNIEKVHDPELKPLKEYVVKHITLIIDKVNKEKEDRLNEYNKSIITNSELDKILKPAMDFYKVKVDLRLELLDKILKNYSLAT